MSFTKSRSDAAFKSFSESLYASSGLNNSRIVSRGMFLKVSLNSSTVTVVSLEKDFNASACPAISMRRQSLAVCCAVKSGPATKEALAFLRSLAVLTFSSKSDDLMN